MYAVGEDSEWVLAIAVQIERDFIDNFSRDVSDGISGVLASQYPDGTASG